ncbi:MAG: hypothetical protein M1819_000949 [Sarea resinae]|nr:MAG: hypothetical protein M1819_000949 [Sarea resinae]
MPSLGSALWKTLKAHQVYGANTNVGKTIVSTVLCNALTKHRPTEKVWYLKPVSTGPIAEADDGHLSRFLDGVSAKCLFQFDEAVSPHIAARSFTPPTDEHILARISDEFSQYAKAGPGSVLLETAGGVHSPGPTGTSQADLYRPLRLPVVLVADSRLGGISSSISAFESLHIRGYDVDSVILFEDQQWKNREYLEEVFGKRGIRTFSINHPPAPREDITEDQQAMTEYYDQMSKFEEVEELISVLSTKHESRIQQLDSMATRASSHIWYPFTQHQGMTPASITTIDSAYGDHFQTYKNNTSETAETPVEDQSSIRSTFDGSASWWTQGLGHANPELTLSAAYAAGRYGHVMFAGAIQEPAMTLAETLLQKLDNPRLDRVFYSDNGSTGMEVAIKMALRASHERYGWKPSDGVGILGLKGSYHGDTIGAMDCSEPSTYNTRVEWYRGRGCWLHFPQVKLSKGSWVVELPEDMQEELPPEIEYSSLSEVFDVERREKTEVGKNYKEYIKDLLEKLVRVEDIKFGALVMEPIILGAGGMILADPLFQRLLVQVVRENPHIFCDAVPKPDPSCKEWSGLPVVFDEVFTGMYRLGQFSSSSYLGVRPDISVHAKLLTGGLLPLCTTLASDSIFQAFIGSQKEDALLHGHSYTAHAIGCQVAVTSVNTMLDMEKSGKWVESRRDWQDCLKAIGWSSPAPSGVWSTWSKDAVHELSYAESVEGIIAIGSVLAISLRDQAGSGYSSTAANSLQSGLLNAGEDWNVHSRTLGNVLYLMASQTSTREELAKIESILRTTLLTDNA